MNRIKCNDRNKANSDILHKSKKNVDIDKKDFTTNSV